MNDIPPSNTWNSTTGCADSQSLSPSITYGVTITGVPAQIAGAVGNAYVWSITLNDGSGNFSIDHYDAAGTLIDHPVFISGVDGSTQFSDPVYLSRDPILAMEAATKEYVDANSLTGQEPPSGTGIYGRSNVGSGSWTSLAPPNLAYLPLIGGYLTGAIGFNGAVTQRIIGGVTPSPGNLWRWGIALGDNIPETGSNTGSNFVLTSYNDAGSGATAQLTIDRQGNTTFSQSCIFPSQVIVNGRMTLQSPAALMIGGGSSGDTLITDGFGNLLWGAGGAGGIPDAPLTGGPYGRQAATWVTIPPSIADAPAINQMYGRYNNGWVQVGAQFVALNPTGTQTINGAITLAGAASVLTVPAPIYLTGAPSNRVIAGFNSAGTQPRWALYTGDSAPESGGNAGSNFAATRYSDTGALIDTPFSISRASGLVSMPDGATTAAPAPGDNSSLVPTTSWVQAAMSGLSVPSNTPPLMDGTAAPGTSGAWSRGDHVHPSDTSRVMKAGDTMTGNLAAPSLSGPTPGTVPVAAASAVAQDNSQNIATTAWVNQWVNANARHGDNRIVNGDCRIDQRNNGASGTATGVYTIDRWLYGSTQAARGTWARGSAAAALQALGFGYFLSFTSSSSYVSLATDIFEFRQPIEADMVGDFAWGTSGAQPVTLSFLVSSTLTGTFGGAISNAATGTRSYPFSYLISAANTWTKIAVTIPGDIAGTWTMSGNGIGAVVRFDLGNGASGRAPAGAWVSGTDIRGANGAVSVVATNAAGFFITGVKLEIGSVATPFNHPPLAQALAACQRYYSTQALWFNAYASAATQNMGQTVTLPTTMRVQPTTTFVSPSYVNCSGLGVALGSATSPGVFATSAAAGAMNFSTNAMTASAEL